MKVLMLSSEFPPRRGGIGTYARELAEAAAALGHEVTVLAPDYGVDQSGFDAALPFKVERFAGMPHTMRQLPGKIALVRAFAHRRPDFDVVHACDWPFYVPLALSAFRGRARALLTFHGTEVRFMKRARRAWLLKTIRFWDGWARYVANSNWTADSLERSFRLNRSDITAIPLGVNASWFEPVADRAQTRRELGIKESRFAIVSLGRLVPRKGHLILAQAFKALPVEIAEQIDWVVIGPSIDQVYAEQVHQAAADLPVRTLFLGSLDQAQVRATLGAADLFCLPGFIDHTGAVEGFGLVYLEAGALGLASVASDAGGVPDAILHGETGLLTPPNDPASTAAAIQRLFEDRTLLATLAKNAQSHARGSTWTTVAEQTYGEISLLGATTPRPAFAEISE